MQSVEARTTGIAQQAASNLFELSGGREEMLHTLSFCSPDDSKANTLRDMLMGGGASGSKQEVRKQDFAKLFTSAGYTAKEIVDLLANRKNAEAMVTALVAKPRMVGELVDAASRKLIVCTVCMGGKRIPQIDEYGELSGYAMCQVCDADGMMLVDGDSRARALYFDQFGFKTDAPLVNIDQSRDNRTVTFVVGQHGTAPSPLSMIRSLESVPDAGNAGNTGVRALPGANIPTEAEIV